MVGGGIAACLLALQVASRATQEEESTPSYTYYRSPAYPRASETASVTTCVTGYKNKYSTSESPWSTGTCSGCPF